MKLIFWIIIAFLSPFVSAQIPIVLELALNADGSLMLMNQSEAIQYCAAQGKHLPSAREMAQVSMSFGTKGIVEGCGSAMTCYSIKAKNTDGSSDDFYFNYHEYQTHEYQRPAGNQGNAYLWSSSTELDYPHFGYFLNGKNGTIAFTYTHQLGAVGCLATR